MSGVRTIFLGTPRFAESHLRTLIEGDHFDVVGVVSQPDRPAGRKMKLTPSPVKELAISREIPVITPATVKDPEVIAKIAGWRAEVAVVVAFGQILPKDFLDLFPSRVVNVHGSLLPRWRGAAPIQRALMAGDRESGLSLQVMVEKLDAGPLIGERKILLEGHDALSLHDEMMRLGSELLTIDLVDYIQGRRTPKGQDESGVTYASKIDKSEAKIKWDNSAEVIFNQIRGLKMGPGSFSLRAGEKIKIHKAVVVSSPLGQPGEVVEVNRSDLVIACGEFSLSLLGIQPESKPKMSVEEYLKGHSIKKGEVWQ
ncbi:methionyl-tRNA formyltransferase [Bdellovibrionales bacterium]|nr:methionyl-tRNA formyltransferase [Bdellovibrionales bacterium]